MGASTFLVMAIFSYPTIWGKFTVDQEFLNPMVGPGGEARGIHAACAWCAPEGTAMVSPALWGLMPMDG